MRHLRVVLAISIVLSAAPAAGQSILLLNEPCGGSAEFYPTALGGLGLSFTETGDSASFVAALTGGTEWDLVIVDEYNQGLDASGEAALAAYIAGGGRVAIDYWDWNDPFALVFEADHVSDYDVPVPVEAWDAAHPVLSSPNAVPDPLVPSSDTCDVDGARFDPVGGGVAIAGYTAAPAAGEAAIIVGNGGRTVLFGGIIGLFGGDTDGDTIPDGQEIAENIVTFLLGGVEPVEPIVAIPTISPGGAGALVLLLAATALALVRRRARDAQGPR